jgi:hypothetical protein
MFATLVGTLQLARVFGGTALSTHMLETGADAALRLVKPHQVGKAT